MLVKSARRVTLGALAIAATNSASVTGTVSGECGLRAATAVRVSN